MMCAPVAGVKKILPPGKFWPKPVTGRIDAAVLRAERARVAAGGLPRSGDRGIGVVLGRGRRDRRQQSNRGDCQQTDSQPPQHCAAHGLLAPHSPSRARRKLLR